MSGVLGRRASKTAATSTRIKITKSDVGPVILLLVGRPPFNLNGTPRPTY
jgi:hypothetical protein